jgi:hypothetical protein
MGRGDRAVRRWKNDRIRAKKTRAQTKSDTARAAAAERKDATATPS